MPPTPLLTRREAARFLTDAGFPCASPTLAKLAYQGGGPRFVKFGLRTLYRPDDLLAWAQSRARMRTSTSDSGVPLSECKAVSCCPTCGQELRHPRGRDPEQAG